MAIWHRHTKQKHWLRLNQHNRTTSEHGQPIRGQLSQCCLAIATIWAPSKRFNWRSWLQLSEPTTASRLETGRRTRQESICVECQLGSSRRLAGATTACPSVTTCRRIRFPTHLRLSIGLVATGIDNGESVWFWRRCCCCYCSGLELKWSRLAISTGIGESFWFPSNLIASSWVFIERSWRSWWYHGSFRCRSNASVATPCCRKISLRRRWWRPR